MTAEPAVGRWFGSYDAARVRAELLDHYVIEVGGEFAGWLGIEEETAEGFEHVGLDIGLVTVFQNQGYGPEALRLAIRHHIDAGHRRFTIDPRVDNARAIRVYERVGFQPVGVMRDYERGDDGTLHDGLLMDLLAAEFEG